LVSPTGLIALPTTKKFYDEIVVRESVQVNDKQTMVWLMLNFLQVVPVFLSLKFEVEDSEEDEDPVIKKKVFEKKEEVTISRFDSWTEENDIKSADVCIKDESGEASLTISN